MLLQHRKGYHPSWSIQRTEKTILSLILKWLWYNRKRCESQLTLTWKTSSPLATENWDWNRIVNFSSVTNCTQKGEEGMYQYFRMKSTNIFPDMAVKSFQHNLHFTTTKAILSTRWWLSMPWICLKLLSICYLLIISSYILLQ